MQFRVTMKDPDALDEAINEAVKKQLREENINDLEEFELLYSFHRNRIFELCKEWFDFGEYLVMEIDTDAKTCVTVKKGE